MTSRICVLGCVGGVGVGAGAGGVLTPYGLIAGAALGVPLGLICALLMTLAVRLARPAHQRLALIAPPATVVGGLSLAVTLWGWFSSGGYDTEVLLIGLVGLVVAAPLTVLVGWLAAPWALDRPEAWLSNRIVVALTMPYGLAGVTFAGWVTYAVLA